MPNEKKIFKQAQNAGPVLDKAAADAMALDILKKILDEAEEWANIQIEQVIEKL